MKKNLYTFIFLITLTILISPNITHASWWNPISWFESGNKDQTIITNALSSSTQKTMEQIWVDSTPPSKSQTLDEIFGTTTESKYEEYLQGQISNMRDQLIEQKKINQDLQTKVTYYESKIPSLTIDNRDLKQKYDDVDTAAKKYITLAAQAVTQLNSCNSDFNQLMSMSKTLINMGQQNSGGANINLAPKPTDCTITTYPNQFGTNISYSQLNCN